MDFTFTEEQRIGAGVVGDLLAACCTPADRRRLLADGVARDEARWRALCALGLPGALVTERAGGLGLGEADLVLVAEACGAALLPEPLVDHAGIGVPLLAALDHPRALAVVEDALSGDVAVAMGHPANPFVEGAETASVLLIAAEDGLHLLEPEQARLVRRPSVDPFRRLCTVEFDASQATRVLDAEAAGPLVDLAFERGALFAAAQGLGLADAALGLAAAYAGERVQFGRPIGANQAVKHLLAAARVKLEFARPVVHAAAAQLAQRDVFSRGRTSHAKLAALAAAESAARAALQVHGAMGYAWETDPHLYLKRAVALAGAWGDEAFHGRRVAERARRHPITPDMTFAREGADA